MVSLRSASLHSDFQVNRDYIVRTCLRKTSTQKQTRQNNNKSKKTKNKKKQAVNQPKNNKSKS